MLEAETAQLPLYSRRNRAAIKIFLFEEYSALQLKKIRIFLVNASLFAVSYVLQFQNEVFYCLRMQSLIDYT